MELLTNLIDDESAGPLVLTELCGLFMMMRPSTKSLMEGGALEPDNIIFVKLEARIMEFIKKPTHALVNLVLKQIAVSCSWIKFWESKNHTFLRLWFELSNCTEIVVKIMSHFYEY